MEGLQLKAGRRTWNRGDEIRYGLALLLIWAAVLYGLCAAPPPDRTPRPQTVAALSDCPRIK